MKNPRISNVVTCVIIIISSIFLAFVFLMLRWATGVFEGTYMYSLVPSLFIGFVNGFFVFSFTSYFLPHSKWISLVFLCATVIVTIACALFGLTTVVFVLTLCSVSGAFLMILVMLVKGN